MQQDNFTDLQMFNFYDKYSRYNYETNTRETWSEAIQRTTNLLRWLSNNKLSEQVYTDIYNAMLAGEITPSLRLLSTTKKQLEKNSLSLYNCSYLVIDCIEAIAETVYLGIHGVGVGYSVEKHNINKLPVVAPLTNKTEYITVEDTGEAWYLSILQLLKSLWIDGVDIIFDYSLIRPAGTPIKTKGGFASGYKVLSDVHTFIRTMLNENQNKHLRTIDVHDLICYLANCSISGAIRRTALLALFDEDDAEMTFCKKPEYLYEKPYRYNSNNSYVLTKDYYTKHEIDSLMQPLFDMKTGDPNIVSRYAIIKNAPTRRKFMNHPELVGTNPCCEIYLSSLPYIDESNKGGGQFCNLSSVICKSTDTLEDVLRKTKLATLIGDIQSLATNFGLLRPDWKTITETERLLGVNILGFADCKYLDDEEILTTIKNYAIEVDKEFAALFNVSQSAAITSIKPSGNTSVLYNTSPGINNYNHEYYYRNVLVMKHTVMFKFLMANNVPYQQITDTKYVFKFPVSHENCKTNDNTTVEEQLNLWLKTRKYLLEHNASCSITYRKNEIDQMKQFVYDHQDYITGIAMFPFSEIDGYIYLPIEKIDKEQYQKAIENFPDIQWQYFNLFEHNTDDRTIVAECAGGSCLLV